MLNALHVAEGEWALVHDAARPCLTHEDLDALIVAAMASGGAILGSRVRDTMKRTDAAGNILATVDREQLWHALTPQMFWSAPQAGAGGGLALGAAITDEASAMERAGFPVRMVEGRADNIKGDPAGRSLPGRALFTATTCVPVGTTRFIPRGAGMIRTGHGFDETDFRVLRRAQA